MSQNRIRLGFAANGSITAGGASGIRIMSDSLMAFQPSMEEPSNMIPSRKASSPIVEMCWAVWCHLPRGSVNLRSTYSTACSLYIAKTLAISLSAAGAVVAFFAIRGFPRSSQPGVIPRPCPEAAQRDPGQSLMHSLAPSRQSRGINDPSQARREAKKSDCVFPAFAGSDPHDLLDVADEDLAVADAPGAGGG